jgi:hypothetical protein
VNAFASETLLESAFDGGRRRTPEVRLDLDPHVGRARSRGNGSERHGGHRRADA